MKNLYIYCEGPTEESFINNVLSPYLLDFDVYARPIVCMTKRTNTVKYKGGVSDYRKIKAELSNICKQHIFKIREQFISPEHINNSADSAPSKRIMNLLPGYAKVSDGTIISARIGISAILAECEHFREWIKRIKMISS